MSKDTLTHQLTGNHRGAFVPRVTERSLSISIETEIHSLRARRSKKSYSLSRSILFPGYFGNSSVNISTIKYHIGVRVEKLYEKLSEQITCRTLFCQRL